MTFYLRKGPQEFIRVHLSQIKYLEASSNYCIVHTELGKFIYCNTMGEMAQKLIPNDPRSQFIKPHRSYIVNVEHVDRIDGNTLHIGDKTIELSRTTKVEVKGRFNIIR